MLVEIVADDGRSGWGEAYGPPAPRRTIIDGLYAARLAGRDSMDTTPCGGFTEAARIAALANTWGVTVSPHV